MSSIQNILTLSELILIIFYWCIFGAFSHLYCKVNKSIDYIQPVATIFEKKILRSANKG